MHTSDTVTHVYNEHAHVTADPACAAGTHPAASCRVCMRSSWCLTAASLLCCAVLRDVVPRRPACPKAAAARFAADFGAALDGLDADPQAMVDGRAEGEPFGCVFLCALRQASPSWDRRGGVLSATHMAHGSPGGPGGGCVCVCHVLLMQRCSRPYQGPIRARIRCRACRRSTGGCCCGWSCPAKVGAALDQGPPAWALMLTLPAQQVSSCTRLCAAALCCLVALVLCCAGSGCCTAPASVTCFGG